MTELSPTQVALRELTMLTKCYCDGEHPRLGHNCSFRRDVETVVGAVQRVLALTSPANIPLAPDPWVIEHLDEIRRAVLGLPPDPGPPWDSSGGNGNATPDVSDGEGSTSAPG